MARCSLRAAVLLVVAGCSPTSSVTPAADAASDADASVAAVASDGSASNASPDASLPSPLVDYVGVDPSDLTTAIGTTTELAIWADDGFGTTPAAMLTDLAAHAQLRTYPELLDVNFTTSIRPPAADPSAHATRSFVVIHPTTPLADRWYVLSLSSLPSGAIGFPNAGRPGLGAVSSRFNPASAPVRRRVSLCDKGAAERIVVEFSEGIALSSVGSLLMVGDDTCTYAPPGSAESQSQLYFDCALSMRGAPSLHFVLKRGIVSPTGVPLGIIDDSASSNATLVDTADRDETLSFAGLVESSGCVDRIE